MQIGTRKSLRVIEARSTRATLGKQVVPHIQISLSEIGSINGDLYSDRPAGFVCRRFHGV